jgi:hypothetical protein
MTMTQCGWPWAAEEKAEGGVGRCGLPSPEPKTKRSLERIGQKRQGAVPFGGPLTAIHPEIQDMKVWSFT